MIRATWLGTATLRLDLGGMRVLTDPALGGQGTSQRLGWTPLTGELRSTRLVPPALPEGGVGPIDVALVSHDHHRDNLDDAGLEAIRRAGLILTTVDGARRLAKKGLRQVVGLAPWQTHRLEGGGEITATPARHGPPLTRWMTGPVIGFVLRSPRLVGPVWLTGDTRWFAPLEEVIRRFDPRTVVAHAGAASLWGLYFTLTTGEVVKLARAAPRARLVPIHTDGWSHFSQGAAVLKEAIDAAGLSGRTEWLTPGEEQTVDW